MIIVLILCVLYVLSTVSRKGHDEVQSLYGWNYAHRGLYGDGVPENSIEAFRRAREHGYGVELDVRLLADGNVAVFHDSGLQRITGMEGRVEDLTIEQLPNYFLETTMQTIPEFGQVLRLLNGRVPLIVELKTADDNFVELCEKVCEMLEGYHGIYALESFDPRCVRWLRMNRPHIIRGQLVMNFLKNKKPKTPWIFCLLMTNQMLNFWTLPDFIAYQFSDRKTLSNWIATKLWKTPIVLWTVKNKREHNACLKKNRIPIFEKFEP